MDHQLSTLSDSELQELADALERERRRRVMQAHAERFQEQARRNARLILENAAQDTAFNPKAVAWAKKVLFEK